MEPRRDAAEAELVAEGERGKRARQDWDWVGPALKFKIVASQGNARASLLELPHYTCFTPMFMPVGTQGTVKGLTPAELEQLDCHLILGNTYHLGNRPGADVVAEMGGLHKFIHWPRAMLTDSGGFQMGSLLKLAEITEQCLKFQSPLDGTEMLLTPELSMEVQNKLGADIMMALDDVVPATCTDPARVEEAMHRTLRWIVRCENAHKRKSEQNLFPIVQGGLDPRLRTLCLEGLIKLNAPGYAIGGLSGGESKDQFWRVVLQCASALPPHKPRYLMGVGYAVDLVVCTALGVDMFDCVYPTRTARFGTALVPWGTMQLKAKEFAADFAPIDASCACTVCKNYTRAYLHLVAAKEPIGCQLLTLHNIAYQMRLMREMRTAIIEQRFPAYVQAFFLRQFPAKNYPSWAVDALNAVHITLP